MSEPDPSVNRPPLPSEKDYRLAIEVLKRYGMANVESVVLSGDERSIERAESLGRVVTDLRSLAEQARVAEQGRVDA